MGDDNSKARRVRMWRMLRRIGLGNAVFYLDEETVKPVPLLPLHSPEDCVIGVSPEPNAKNIRAVVMHGDFRDPVESMAGLYSTLCMDYALRNGIDDLYTADALENMGHFGGIDGTDES